MLLDFQKPRLKGGGAVFIDSEEVASVEDVNAGPHEVCQVTMKSGETHMIEGKAHPVAERIRTAQAETLAVFAGIEAVNG